MRTMKKIIKFVKIILLIIISGCNTTVINKQELKNENMTAKELKTIIDKKIKYHEDYSEWLKERKANELKFAEERAKAKAEADRIEAENKALLKAEQEKKAKLEAELKAKLEAEQKAETERKQAEAKAKIEAEKLQKAPLKKQLTIWVESFSIAEINIENEKKTLIKEKFEAFKKWAKNEIENI